MRLLSTLSFFCLFQLSLSAADLTEFIWSGAVTEDSVSIKTRLRSESTQVRAVVSTAPDLSNPIHSTLVSASNTTDLIAEMTLSTLAADTQYYYGIEVDGQMDDRIGKFHTFTTNPKSFKFAFGACAITGSASSVFASILNEDPLFYLCAGDFFYKDIGINDVDLFRNAYKLTLDSETQRTLYQNVPIAYMWDDHDYGPNNSDAGSPSRQASRLTYQEYVPHYDLAAGSGDVPIYQSFALGRVKFILSDLRSVKNEEAGSAMGSVQKAWFKQQLIDGRDNYKLIVWVSTIPWIGGHDDDHWGSHGEERDELAGYIKDNGVKNLCMLAGDAHMLAIDNGTNNRYPDGGAPGFPVFHAAALDRQGSTKGGPYSEGSYPGGGQYGLFEVIDNGGDSVTVNWTGKDMGGSTIVTHSFTAGDLSTNTITASAGSDGSIDPVGAVSVLNGTDQTFTMTPDDRYRVTDVRVDGRSVGAVSSYTFENVTSNHWIDASFALKEYDLTYTAGIGGSISSGDASQRVQDGSDGTEVTAAPVSAFYEFAGWSDGVMTETRTDTQVVSDISVTANFISTASRGLWTPAELPATYSWYDASDPNAITYDSGTGNISVWADKSGNGQDMLGADAPKTGIETINGLNVMTMNGDRAHFAVVNYSTPTSGSLSLFMLVSVDSVNNADDSLFTFKDSAKILELAPNSSAQFDGAILSSNMDSLSATFSGGPFSGMHMFNTAFDATSDTVDVHVDASLNVSNNTYTANLENVIDDFYLFRGSSGAKSRMAPGGKLAEVIIVDGTVSPDDREKIEGYLAHKWGMQDKLPEGHAYKGAAPLTEVESSYENWAALYDLGAQKGMSDDPDGDQGSNMMEFAFGTDPTRMSMGPLATDGSRHGHPVTKPDPENEGGLALYFMRRKDYGQSGSLIYRVRFSNDLVNFEDNTAQVRKVADSRVNGIGADYEVVKVPFPNLPSSGEPAEFGNVHVEPATAP